MTHAQDIPKIAPFAPVGMFKILMVLGQQVPGRVGHIRNRKLKRGYCRRAVDSFAQVVSNRGPEDLCIDLGANSGTVTAQMAASGADVISFEPEPDTFAVLQANTGGLENVILHQNAAGAKAERLLRRRSARRVPDNPIRESMASSVTRSDRGMSDASSVPVEGVDFVHFLRTLGRNVRVLKIDMDGAEWDLSEALLEDPVLHRTQSMCVETHERVDPHINIARFNRLAARALALDCPYINLYL